MEVSLASSIARQSQGRLLLVDAPPLRVYPRAGLRGLCDVHASDAGAALWGKGTVRARARRAPSPLRQTIVVPLAIVAALVVARVDGVHYAPVATILTPFWLIDAGVLVGELSGEGERQRCKGLPHPRPSPRE